MLKIVCYHASKIVIINPSFQGLWDMSEKDSQQAGRYDMLQNAAGEILIIIEYREGGPENPRLVYDGGDQALLYRSRESAFMLNSIAKVINEYDQTMVQVYGYTDNTGSAATNNALSLRRANAVSKYLRLRGVDGNRIITDGLGSASPIASNATAAGREQNRRVEISLISK